VQRLYVSVSLLLSVAACGSETFLDSNDASSPGDGGAAASDAGGTTLADGAPNPGGACPAGMIRTKHTCVDAREVTYREYGTFVAAMNSEGPSNLPAFCDDKKERSSFVPSGTLPENIDLPVAHVDWCDAFVYCRAAGKRLCARIAGGRAGATQPEIVGTEWYEACSKGTQKVSYPLAPGATGNEPGRCVLAASGTSPVTRPGNRCEGAYPGIFDMIGNVEEWIDACASDSQDTNCVAIGSAYDDTLDFTDSACDSMFVLPRDARNASIGFRCCR
jgi:formylglycine-generating enzyme